ncbi:hypothetical protein KJ786_01710 [Patescibacteria group bacterium]|nr:hypothetical protein [Patescibacteria group bacterium]
MATARKLKKIPKLVGYCSASFVAVVITLSFFWLLFTFYDTFLIIDSETHVQVQSFFNILFFVFYLILGFTVFPILIYLFLRLISFFAKKQKKGKKSVLKTISKNEKKIIYNTAIGYWFLYVVGLAIYYMFYLSKAS